MSAVSKLGKVVSYIVAVPVALGLLLFIALYLANIRDEPLRPEVSAALASRHDSVPDGENVFFPLLALDVRDSRDLAADGRRLYANYLTAFQRASAAPLSLQRDPAFSRLAFAGDKNQLCGTKTQEECLQRAIADPAGTATLLADNAALLEHYQRLQPYVHFQNRLRPTASSPMIGWEPFLTAKRLFLTSVALDCAQRRVAAGVLRLRAEADFTRRLLAEPDVLLVDKLVLGSSYRGDLLLATEILRRVALAPPDYDALREIAAPMKLEERSLRGPLEREYDILATVLAPLDDPHNAAGIAQHQGTAHWLARLKGRLEQHFFQLHASMNGAWLDNETARRLSETSCQSVRIGESVAADSPAPGTLSYAYNPIGKILVYVARLNTLSQAGTFCDLEAMQRIVALQTVIHQQRVADGDVSAFIEHSGPELTDPYTGQPFHWNATTREVSFDIGNDRDSALVRWRL